jgi:hypothetical protein
LIHPHLRLGAFHHSWALMRWVLLPEIKPTTRCLLRNFGLLLFHFIDVLRGFYTNSLIFPHCFLSNTQISYWMCATCPSIWDFDALTHYNNSINVLACLIPFRVITEMVIVTLFEFLLILVSFIVYFLEFLYLLAEIFLLVVGVKHTFISESSDK